MCLVIDQKATNDLKQRFEESKDGTLTFWKCYEAGTDILYPPCRANCPYLTFGKVISDRVSKQLSACEKKCQIVNQGIHVFTTRNAATAWDHGYGYIIVKVTAHKNDLVSGGFHNEAVFMKVTISKRTWSNIFGAEK